jgi:Putative lumazine-binding
MSKYLIVLVLGFSAIIANGQSTEEAGIKETINNLFEGMRKSDAALIQSALAENAVLQSIKKNKEGKLIVQSESVADFLTAITKPHTEVYDERIVFETIKIDGPLASVWTPYKFYIGATFSHCGVDSYQLVKIDGKWKIQYLIDTRRKDGCE